MRLSRELIGKQIISIDDGTHLKQVEDVYVDANLMAIRGLYLGRSGFFFRKRRFLRHIAPKEQFIHRSDIAVLGNHAILVNNDSVVRDSSQDDAPSFWLRRDTLYGRDVVTGNGRLVGTLGDLLIDDRGSIKGITLSTVRVNSPITHSRVIMRELILAVQNGRICVAAEALRVNPRLVSV